VTPKRIARSPPADGDVDAAYWAAYHRLYRLRTDLTVAEYKAVGEEAEDAAPIGRAPTEDQLADFRLMICYGAMSIHRCPMELSRSAPHSRQRLGAALYHHSAIEKVLNHVSGSFAWTVGIYQRHEFAEEKRAALEKWADHVERLVR
jgi:hypothetical protein